MAIPEQVKKQMEADEKAQAEELARVQAEADGVTAPETTTATTPANPPVVADPPQPQGQDGEVARLTAELERMRVEKEAADQRWRTSQGMLAKRESDKDEALRQMTERLNALEKRNAEPPTPKEPAKFKYLTPEEREAMKNGGDSDPLEFRQSKGEIEAAKEELLARMDAQRQEVLAEFDRKTSEQAAAQAREQQSSASWSKFVSEVEKLAPGFTVANDTAGSNWTKFLDSPDRDSVTGGTYRDSASALVQAGRAKGVAELFKAYQAIDPSGSKARQLESQVRPDTSRATGRPTATTEDTITMQMYDQFYKDLRQGTLRPNPDGTRMTPAQVADTQGKLDTWYYNEQLAGRLKG